MENADRSTVISMPVDHGMQEARNMILRRDPALAVSKETVFDVNDIVMLWSFVRGNTAAIGVEQLNKGVAASIVSAAKKANKNLVVVYTNKRTNDGRRILEEHAAKVPLLRIENWRLKHIYLNPLKYKYFQDAGLVRKADITPKLIERIGNPSENGETYESDPLPRYLGAEIGDLVWTDNTWGTLEPSRDYRIVISAKTVPKLFLS